MLDKLTEEETEVFEAIRDEKYDNFALVRSHLDGEDVAVIATVNGDDDDVIITPLAVLVTDKIMDRLVDPSRE